MFVKICGITRPEDAGMAVGLGADAVGFVCWPGSPRFVDAGRIRAILAGLPTGVRPVAVGVFVNQPVREIEATMASAGLDVAQLHGDEGVDVAEALSCPVIKAIAAGDGPAVDLSVWPRRVTILIDAHDPVRRGGTGHTADWTGARRIARARRALLAGGLHAGNVADAVDRVRPFGVDVSSGVEASPGIKSAERLREFFHAIRQLPLTRRGPEREA